jgi:WD40 repeat protein/serine/threonine protein kinase
MDTARAAQRDRILAQALSVAPGRRMALLDEVCAGDPDLRAEVECLLRANDQVSTEFAPRPAAQGAEFGPYHLLQLIGQGGMGEVWLADQKAGVRRRVALKLIKAGMDTRDVVRRFESERQALALMDHPAIAKVFDAGATPEGRPYFAMEYVPGFAITDYCDKHRLTTKERLELFVRVCEGVQHAHQKAIIHRDLKPSNILVSEVDGKAMPKIIDFGVAKATARGLTSDTLFTRFGTVIGTPEYMSPEQAGSSVDDIDTRADVYSLGVILYELLVGALPLDYRKLAFHEVLRRLREEDAPRPSTRFRTLGEQSAVIARNRRAEQKTLTRQLRGDLDCLALKALEKDRTRRYGSPSELAADIRRHLENRPIAASPATIAYRAQKFATRYRWGIAAAAACVTLLLAGIVITTREALRANRERDRAVAAERHANAQKLAAYAIASLPEDPERSITLAMYSVNATLPFQLGVERAAEEALHTAIGESHARLTLIGHADSLTSVAFSPDGSLLATASWDGTAKLWDGITGQERLTLRAHPKYVVNAVAFSPDGRGLATAGADGTAKLWDTATGREVLVFDGRDGPVEGVAFHPDGRRIATAAREGTIRMWDVGSGRSLSTWRVGEPASCVAFSPDGGRIAACGGRTVDIRKPAGGALLSILADRQAVWRAVFSPDGSRMATAGAENIAKVWDASTGRETLQVAGGQSRFTSVAFSPDSKWLGIASDNGTATVRDLAAGREFLTLRSGLAGLKSVVFSPDGKSLAGGSQNGTAKVWDLSDRGEWLTFHARGRVVDAAFSPDGTRFATANGDGAIEIRDAATGRIVLTMRGHERAVTSVQFSAQGKYLASGSVDGAAKLWAPSDGSELRTFRGHKAEVWCVSFSPDSSRLATASADRTIRVWDVTSGRELITLRQEEQAPCAAFTPDGERIIAASADNTFTIWDAKTGRQVLVWRAALNRPITALALSPDGREIAAASGNMVGVWSASTGRNVTTLHPGPGFVAKVRFSSDGRQLAAVSYDASVTVWDTRTWTEALQLRVRDRRPEVLAFSPDGRRLLTGGAEGIVSVYALEIHDLLEVARKRVTRPLTVAECRTYFQSETCPALP